MKAYRIGVIGFTGSGKTALLCALAMPKMLEETEQAVIWERPTVPSDQKKPDDPASTRIEEGRKWLEAAMDSLEKGDIPPANPPTQPDMTFRYIFTDPKRPKKQVELIDYAGELLDSTQLGESSAKKLFSKLKEMDAWLVLAPVSYPNAAEDGQLWHKLTRLQETFAQLHNLCGQIDIPVALLCNMWDRQRSLECRKTEIERQKLEDFLSQTPSHRNLCNAIRGMVGDANVMVFPVSALGDCERRVVAPEREIERPRAAMPLRPFGLTEPFMWAIDRHDAIQQQEAVWRKEIRYKHFRNFSRGAAVLFIAWVGSCYYWDKQILNTLKNVQAEQAELQEAEKWLAGDEVVSELAGNFRVFLENIPTWPLSVEESRKWLVNLRTRPEERLWEQAKQGNNTSLNDYLRRFPNGKFHAEAENLHATIQEKQDTQRLLEEIREQMRSRNYLGAARLFERCKDNPECIQIESDFEPQIFRELPQQINELIGKHDWEKARKTLGQVGLLSSRLCSLDCKKKRLALVDQVDEAEDRFLYHQVLETKNLSDCETYLDRAPLKTMTKSITVLKQHLMGNEQKRDLRLKLTEVSWQEKQKEVGIRLYVNNAIAFEISQLKVNGKISYVNQEVTIREKPLAIVDVHVVLEKQSCWSVLRCDIVIGEIPNKKISLTSMAEHGYVLHVENTAHDAEVAQITLLLSGLPNLPSLQEWHR